MNRRRFLNTVAAGTASAMAMPTYSYKKILGSNERIVAAVAGTNSRGDQLTRQAAPLANFEIRYICDVDSRAMEKTASAVEGIVKSKPRVQGDFRKVLDDPELDVLIIAMPDHWHAPAAILACTAGKHVYVEKPASHNPREGELMVQAARKNSRIVQLGNQRRSWPGVMDAIEELKNGAIGPVHYARSWYAQAREPIGFGKPAPVPDRLNYELWQGPAPRRDYKDNLIHYNWHWFWHWGTGEAANNGVHTIDLGRWGLGVNYPTRVSASGGRFFLKDDAETPDTEMLTFEFDGGKFITWEGLSASANGMRPGDVGSTFHGENGTLFIQGNGYKIFDRDNNPVKEVNTQTVREVKDASGALGLDAVHIFDFLESIRNNRLPHSEIEEGHKSTLLCHLGNIAYRVGRNLICDPVNGHIINDSEAAAL